MLPTCVIFFYFAFFGAQSIAFLLLLGYDKNKVGGWFDDQ